MAGFVSTEPVAVHLRFHPHGGGFGSPWSFICTVTPDGDTALISGAAGRYTRDVRKAIQAALLGMGFRSARFLRVNGRRRVRVLRAR